MERLHFAVVGAGAVGQLLAGYLAERGHTAVLVARPRPIAGARRDLDVRLAPEGGAARAVTVGMTGAIPTSATFDAVFLAVRGDQLPAALDTLRASGIESRGLVLCMPVWGPDPAYAIDGFDATWLMFPGFGAKVLDSGAVEHFFSRRPSEIGPMRGPITAPLQRLADVLADAGIPTKAKPDLGYRYTALSAAGGPFAVAIARSGFDLNELARNRGLLRTCARAARECIALAEARTGRSLGASPRLLASAASVVLAALAPILARRASSGRLEFILSHRRKVAGQDRAMLSELYRWGLAQGREAPALASLLGVAGEIP